MVSRQDVLVVGGDIHTRLDLMRGITQLGARATSTRSWSKGLISLRRHAFAACIIDLRHADRSRHWLDRYSSALKQTDCALLRLELPQGMAPQSPGEEALERLAALLDRRRPVAASAHSPDTGPPQGRSVTLPQR